MNICILDMLKCVDCGSRGLIPSGTESGEISFGKLSCPECGSEFPVYDGIPVLISNRVVARFLPPEVMQFCIREKFQFGKSSGTLHEADRVTMDSAKNWGFQWWESRTGFGDPHNYFLTEKAFRKFIPIKQEEYSGKNVLVAGAGFGREVGHLVRYSCRNIFAVDISRSIFLAKEAFRGNPSVHCIMADITNLPFSGEFDIVISDHVLHHLPDIHAGVKGLLALVKPGGIFSCNFYSRENNFVMHSIVEPLKAHLLARLSLKSLMVVALPLAVACFLTTRAYKFIAMISASAARWLPLGEHFLFWSGLPFHWLWKAVIFDLLQAPLAQYLSKNDLRRLFEKYEHVQIGSHAGTLWVVRASV